MGITYFEAKRLWELKLSGFPLSSFVAVAHQQLFLHQEELDSLRRDFQAHQGSKKSGFVPLEGYQFGEYIDRFCAEFLDLPRIDTIDYSPYEGASIIQDMNQPVPESLHGRFDLVLEAGSLEHIFNFPVAVSNVMRMVRVGGVVLFTTVANNLCGHGFYQFSPELIFRVFSPENGFSISRVLLLEAYSPWVELTPPLSVYEVRDPKDVGRRVGLRSDRPVMMMVEARRISDCEPFLTVPQQSDYSVAWTQGQQAAVSSAGGVKPLLRNLFRRLPRTWRNRVEAYRANRDYSFDNKSFFRRLQ